MASSSGQGQGQAGVGVSPPANPWTGNTPFNPFGGTSFGGNPFGGFQQPMQVNPWAGPQMQYGQWGMPQPRMQQNPMQSQWGFNPMAMYQPPSYNPFAFNQGFRLNTPGMMALQQRNQGMIDQWNMNPWGVPNSGGSGSGAGGSPWGGRWPGQNQQQATPGQGFAPPPPQLPPPTDNPFEAPVYREPLYQGN